MSIDLRSPAFEPDAPIPGRYAKSGDDVAPPLRWSGVPEGTAELAIVVQDPDAPSGTFTHWIVAGLDPNIEGLDGGQLPEGAVEGRNDFGDVGYGGPQPPGNERHRYVFRVIALEEGSGIGVGDTYQRFHDSVQGKEIGRGELVAHYP